MGDMPTEGLRRIREAEDEAESLIDIALDGFDRTLQDTRHEASRRILSAEARAKNDSDEIRARLALEAESEAQEIGRRAEVERGKVRDQALSRMAEAVGSVLEVIEKP